MKQDAEAEMIGFYLLRGHSLNELLSLSTIDKLFYVSAMEIYIEEIEKNTKEARE